jgi:hypothetical protein
VPVRIFDHGRHHRPAVHPEPLSATLLFIPGALLRNGRGCVPAASGGEGMTKTQDPADKATLDAPVETLEVIDLQLIRKALAEAQGEPTEAARAHAEALERLIAG